MSSDLIRVAYGSIPKDSGTFTFYRNLRPALLKRGVELICVSVGTEEGRLWEHEYADDGCILLGGKCGNLKKQAEYFSNWCDAENIDIVMGINSTPILSALPHLSKNIRIVSRCANGFELGYRISMACAERLMGIIALTPKLKLDLISTYGANAEKIFLIPNGINPAPFEDAVAQVRGADEKLELGFLGRLEHTQKGVLYLPGIINALNARKVPFRFRIAGKGKHYQKLVSLFENEIASGQVEFVGALTHTEVPKFLSSLDVFLFTSHFEGCPNALLEAMMAGVVPVSWTIKGVTDFVLDDGVTGFLAETGDADAFSSHIETLHQDRKRLDDMHNETAKAARDRFADTVSAQAYSEFFHGLMLSPVLVWEPKEWSAFQPDKNFPQTYKRFLPNTLKKAIKNIFNQLSEQR